MADIADAAGFAHSRGVVHQDLKPANILIERPVLGSDSIATSRISDFGFAFSVDGDGTESDHLRGGTPDYMAPEQHARDAAAIGTHTDVYAMGIMLAEMLGQAPRFTRLAASRRRARSSSPPTTSSIAECGSDGDAARTPSGATDQVVREESDLLAAAPFGLRLNGESDLRAIVEKCLQPEPERRYRNGWDLRDDLLRYLTDQCVTVRSISSWETLIRAARQHPLVVALSMGLLLSVVVGAAVSVSQAVRTKRAESTALAALAETENARAEAKEAASGDTAQQPKTQTLGRGSAGFGGTCRCDSWAAVVSEKAEG